MTTSDPQPDRAQSGPLHDLRVLDLSTVIAGPKCAAYLADFGADVIKVERPGTGDSLRNMAWRDPRDGTGLWWKIINRNKRTIALDLKDPDDLEVLRCLVRDAHVLVENFRPGTMERLGLAPAALHEINPTLVITRVTGFGQTGPYRNRAGFATIAEAMSGLSAISGEPGGQPLLPPIALTDEVTGLSSALATMIALRAGVGQVVDVTLLESMFQLMGPLLSLYRLTGEMQERLGAGLPYTVPRGTYRCNDDRWIAVSASADSVADRVTRLLGVGDDPRFATFQDRMANREALEAVMVAFCAQRSQFEVIEAFTAAEAAIGPVMDMADIAADPHYAAREAIVELDSTPMQGLIAQLSETPGALRWAGRALDADGADIRANGWGRDDRDGGISR
ncbi:MAG: putative CoA-transferase [Acidimicrobiales bacterium]|nr:putative CoA-transferase [Acidimicrobiales bacterium]